MLCSIFETYSEIAKINTASIVPLPFFLPKKTIANAIQPRPDEIFGTKEETRNTKKIPHKEANNAAKTQEKVLYRSGFTPRAKRTSGLLPVILIRLPVFVLFKVSQETIKRMYIITTPGEREKKALFVVKSSFIRTPCVEYATEDKSDTNPAQRRFIASPIKKGFAPVFSVNSDAEKRSSIQERHESMAPII